MKHTHLCRIFSLKNQNRSEANGIQNICGFTFCRKWFIFTNIKTPRPMRSSPCEEQCFLLSKALYKQPVFDTLRAGLLSNINTV